MWKRDAIEHFGSKAAVARAIGIYQSAVTGWGDIVPFHSALMLNRASDGKVAMHEKHYKTGGRIKRETPVPEGKRMAEESAAA